MNEYITIKDVKIPIEMARNGLNWRLDLVVNDNVYYWNDNIHDDIALMYSIKNNRMDFINDDYFGYESMYEDTMAIIYGSVHPLYVSDNMEKCLESLGGMLK